MARQKQKDNSKGGRLRIVAGNWRTRLLDIADVDGLRPTSERIRETLFNWLSPRIHGAHCLDLFVDASGATVRAQDARDYLCGAPEGPFDVVFLDPPFAADLLEETCRLLAMPGLLANGALVYLEQDRSHPEPELPAGWQITKNKTAGKVRYMLAKVEKDD
jgi:16S rRNA (guanine966-N2)-methyltransferase